MRRREFIAALGSAAAWPVLARAQDPGRTYRVGFLIPNPWDSPPVVVFFDELRLKGFIKNQNLESAICELGLNRQGEPL